MKINCKVCGMVDIESPSHPLYKFGPHYFCGFWHWMSFIVKKFWARKKRKRCRCPKDTMYNGGDLCRSCKGAKL